MSIYIAHRRRKTYNALDTLVLSEQECFQWTSKRLVTTRRITEVSRQRIPSHWSLLNCFRTEQGHCGACRRKWRLTDTDLCPCGETQTMSHIVKSCPDKTEWQLISVTLCGWRRCFIPEEEEVMIYFHAASVTAKATLLTNTKHPKYACKSISIWNLFIRNCRVSSITMATVTGAITENIFFSLFSWFFCFVNVKY